MIKQKIRLKARLILYDKGKILLLKQTKPKGGNFTLVGGTIEKFEYVKEALIREAYEEAGITLEAKDLQLVHVLQKNSLKEQRVIFYFKAFRWAGELSTKEPHKFKSAKWFYLYNVPKNLTTTVRHVLKQYRKGLLYSEFPVKKIKNLP